MGRHPRRAAVQAPRAATRSRSDLFDITSLEQHHTKLPTQDGSAAQPGRPRLFVLFFGVGGIAFRPNANTLARRPSTQRVVLAAFASHECSTSPSSHLVLYLSSVIPPGAHASRVAWWPARAECYARCDPLGSPIIRRPRVDVASSRTRQTARAPTQCVASALYGASSTPTPGSNARQPGRR